MLLATKTLQADVVKLCGFRQFRHNTNAFYFYRLLKAGADANAALPDSEVFGDRPLHLAIDAGRYAQTLHLTLPIVDALIAHGADVNAQDTVQFTPLLVATITSYIDASDIEARDDGVHALCTTLIGNGANVHVMNPQVLFQSFCFCKRRTFTQGGKSALHYVAGGGNTATLRLLIEKGADATAVDDEGRTPLHTMSFVAQRSSHVRIGDALKNAGANINAKDNDGRTPLHNAVTATKPCLEYISWLLQQGADVNARTNDGATPLYKALGNNFAFMRTRNESVNIIKTLLAHGAKVARASDNEMLTLELIQRRKLFGKQNDFKT